MSAFWSLGAGLMSTSPTSAGNNYNSGWRRHSNSRFLVLLHYSTTRRSSPLISCSSSSSSSSNNHNSLPKQTPPQLGYDPSVDLLGIQVDPKPRDAISSDSPKPRSWFGPNGQYIRELPCPSCRGRGYTPCSDSPLKVKEDDEVDNLEIKLTKKKSKRVYQSLSPEVGLKISQSLKSLNAKTGLFSKRMKIIHRDPMLHAQRVAAIKKAKGTAAARKRASETLKAFFSDPKNRKKRSIAMKGVKFYCSNCGREGHRKHYCPELKDSLIDRRFKCRLCGKKGHNSRTCPKPRTSNQKGKVTWHRRCKICRQRGHNRRSCPQVIGLKLGGSDTFKDFLVSGSRKYTCRLCQEEGHNARTCPSRNAGPAILNPPRE
ncbi:unnamed protein product [Dovyalis caffra]|uniref:CCHC-type domain-containing protein n=1 Tax=Dovyalis caffra TaxID=77055 RepID=A0AAV1QZ06_9ROSI|nr:unnamed protein product [Dovyalis caffra]